MVDTLLEIGLVKDLLQHQPAITARDAGQDEQIKSQLANITVLANIEYSPAVQQADLRRTAVIRADTAVVEQLRKAKCELTDLIYRSVDSKVGK